MSAAGAIVVVIGWTPRRAGTSDGNGRWPKNVHVVSSLGAGIDGLRTCVGAVVQLGVATNPRRRAPAAATTVRVADHRLDHPPHGDEGEGSNGDRHGRACVLGESEIERRDGHRRRPIGALAYPESTYDRRASDHDVARAPSTVLPDADPAAGGASPAPSPRRRVRRDAVAAVVAAYPRFLEAWAPSAMPAATRSSATRPTGSATTADSTLCGQRLAGLGYVRWASRQQRVPALPRAARRDGRGDRRGRRGRALRAVPPQLDPAGPPA